MFCNIPLGAVWKTILSDSKRPPLYPHSLVSVVADRLQVADLAEYIYYT